MNASALSPEQADLISKALEKAFSAEADDYEDGKCPELALALAESLPNAQLCIGTRHWKEWGKFTSNKLSHVVVNSGTWDFDSRGNWAILRWEERWEGDYSDKPDEEVSFSWQPVAKATLIGRVRKFRDHAPEIDWNLVNQLENRLNKIIRPILEGNGE